MGVDAEVKSAPPAGHITPRATTTGLTDSTHVSSGSSGSSSSAERYQLDEFDTNPILLYTYRGRLTTSSQKDLCAQLDKDESLRCTRKPLPRGASYLDIRRHDLFLPEEKRSYEDLPNYDASIAAISVPMMPYLSRMFMKNRYENLFIVSKEGGGSSTPSPVDSLGGSVASL